MPVDALTRWLRPRGYKALLTTLAVLVVALPLAQQLGIGQWLLQLMIAIVLASAIQEIAGDRRGMRTALLLGVPAVAGRILAAAWERPPAWLVVLIFISTLLFMVWVVISLMRHILTTERVTGDTLRGAICVYLLLGLTWTIVYGFLLYLDPGALSFADHLVAAGEDTAPLSGVAYFSFVTLTTLGYGDISPISPLARNLAWVEAVVGQLFVAITIARLVGLFIAQRGQKT